MEKEIIHIEGSRYKVRETPAPVPQPEPETTERESSLEIANFEIAEKKLRLENLKTSHAQLEIDMQASHTADEDKLIVEIATLEEERDMAIANGATIEEIPE